MRGIPAFRYLGRNTAVCELEPRIELNRRWSILGFVGAGWAAREIGELSDAETIIAGGGGFRYLLVRMMGFAVGADMAWGPEERAFYVVLGSYWHSI